MNDAPPAASLSDQDLEQAVASLVVVRASGFAGDHQRRYPQWELPNAELKRLLGTGVGGVILLGGSCTDLQQRCRQLRRWAKGPLLLCADVEEGVGQRFDGATWLAPPMAIARLHRHDPARAEALAEQYGSCTGRQARLCGLNWVLAPVTDVNNNAENPVINVRAWGTDPHTVSRLTVAFQRGLRSQGVLGCAKHFPGHGDTAEDSHLQLPVLAHDRARLERLELLPFRACIAADIDSVMTAHLQIPSLDPNQPATLSRAVLTDLLRDQLGFDGLVVTDALVMDAIRAHHSAGEAACLAFAAGADLILMPEDADDAIAAICAGLRHGALPWARLEASLERRGRALRTMALADATPVEESSTLELELASEQALNTTLLELSLEHNQQRVRVQDEPPGINLIRVDGVLPCPQLPATAPALHLPQQAGFQTLIHHPMAVSIWNPDSPDEPLALERLGGGSVLVQLFLRGNPFRAGRDRQEPWKAALRQLQEAGRLAGLAVYGSPYAWEDLREGLDPRLPAAYSPGQMPEAQRCVLEALIDSRGADRTGAQHDGGFTD